MTRMLDGISVRAGVILARLFMGRSVWYDSVKNLGAIFDLKDAGFISEIRPFTVTDAGRAWLLRNGPQLAKEIENPY